MSDFKLDFSKIQAMADAAAAKRKAERATSGAKAVATRLRRSQVSNPCGVVWAIADAMCAEDAYVERKAVVAACVGYGIALLTARTQTQAWHKARKLEGGGFKGRPGDYLLADE